MEMIVWAVSGSWSYDGEDGGSLKLFRSRERADAYAEELLGGDSDYDSVDVWPMEVE